MIYVLLGSSSKQPLGVEALLVTISDFNSL